MIMFIILTAMFGRIGGDDVPQGAQVFDLPDPATDGGLSVEATLQARRSVREYAADPVTLQQLGQLLWAAQGENRTTGRRTAPSAGALYPLELFVLAGDVVHDLVALSGEDLREDLVAAALNQDWMLQASAILVFGAVIERTSVKYGDRAPRYAHMEVGHAAQNVYLQAASLGLATAFAGAFNDDRVSQVLELGDEAPLGIMPIGQPSG
jgi:SagB-type dehydrogenase family enzyme